MIDLPAAFEVLPFGRNAALPARGTTTASSGCAVVGPVTSQMATRSLSITGVNAVSEPAWNSIAQSRRIGTIEAPCEMRWRFETRYPISLSVSGLAGTRSRRHAIAGTTFRRQTPDRVVREWIQVLA